MEEKKLKYWVWLSSLNTIGAKRLNQLLEYFIDPESIWHASETDLRDLPFATDKMIECLLDEKLRENSDMLLERTHKLGIGIVTVYDELYPSCLKNIYDPPIVLYCKGKLVKHENVISVVGSRNATSYGLKIAEKISYELSGCGITIASGMARGIDTSAHKGALKAGGRTIAVLGCGLDTAYPYENRELMELIVDKGAVITEYIPGTKPFAYNFPARNRIISGISVGVVVVEAGEHSGSLITVNFALDQGREVFAVPGNINSINSIGTNRLIKDGAKMVTGIDDILEELHIFKGFKKNLKLNFQDKIMQLMLQDLNSEERKIIECLATEPMHIDYIARKSKLGVQTVSSTLTMMELKGIVEQTSGNIFKLRE